MVKNKFKNIDKFHLNEIELIITAPLLKFFFKPKITSHLRCPLETTKGQKGLCF